MGNLGDTGSPSDDASILSSSQQLGWRQHLSFDGGQVQAVVTLYQVSPMCKLVYRLFSVLTFGLLTLVAHWLPHWWLRAFGRRIYNVTGSSAGMEPKAHAGASVNLATADQQGQTLYAMIHNSAWDQTSVEKIRSHPFGGMTNNVFPPLAMSEGFSSTNHGTELKHIVSFEHRSLQFIWHEPTHQFTTTAAWKDVRWTSLASSNGFPTHARHMEDFWSPSIANVQQRQQVFGSNSLVIPERSTADLIVQEIVHPFTVFQLFSVIIWCANNYYWFASAIVIITVVSGAITLAQTKENIARLRNMGRLDESASVMRARGEWTTVNTNELVPGDLVKLDLAQIPVMPADILVLAGDAVADESMLTGESVPVSKVSNPGPNQILSDLDFSLATFPAHVSRHVLYSGTKLIRSRGPAVSSSPSSSPQSSRSKPVNSNTALGLVIRTGFNTAKGALIRSMLHPRPQQSAMNRDAFRFLGVLGLFGLIGFIYTVVSYVREGASAKVIIIRALDIITIVVPPSLPATLSAGVSFALARLRPRQIFCTSPNAINLAGMVRILVADKTGTLTQDGLEVKGVLAFFPDFKLATSKAEVLDARILACMAACHDVKQIRGGSGGSCEPRLIGDPLDVKMFEWSGWSITDGIDGVRLDSPDGRVRQAVVKQFDFVPALRRMSVIVQDARGQQANSLTVFCKGAPETIRPICDPASLPANFDATVNDYAHRGLRIIALATRTFPSTSLSASRDQIEHRLIFIGFIVFENPLKPGSRVAMESLRDANIQTIMCTGDNLLTAISVARQARLVEPTQRVYLPRESSDASKQGLVWELHGDSSVTLDSLADLGGSTKLNAAAETLPPRLAMTGETFDHLLNYASKHTLQLALKHASVFARMAPEQKRQLVEKMQSFFGDSIMFVGDGANDVSALRAATVGLSLSEAEASIAAPFTSADKDVGCCVTLIREGRAALVTSYSCFKFMGVYSFIQFTSVAILYSIGSNLGDFQFLYIDLIICLPLALSMARSKAAESLSTIPPVNRLMSSSVMTSITFTILLQVAVQLYVFFYSRDQIWYVKYPLDPENRVVRCIEGTAIFVTTAFMYIGTGMCFTAGEPYRAPLIHNRTFIACVCVLLGGSLGLALTGSEMVMAFFDMVSLAPGFQWILLCIAAAYSLVIVIVERLIVPKMDRLAAC
ncbi:hypothetical protein BCR44DRAFT_119419, partial [Catenaria anguillulae PL171]